MGVFAIAALLLAASLQPYLKPGIQVLKSGCEESDTEVARVSGPAPVEIRFALSGCYSISVTQDGRKINGFVSAPALEGLETFEQQRRSAPEAQTIQAPASSAVRAKPGEASLSVAARMLSDNQPRAALEILEAQLTHDRSPSVLWAAAVAAYQSDRLRDASTWLHEATRKQPNPQWLDLMYRVDRQLASDRSSELLSGNWVSLRFDPAFTQRESARQMVAALDAEYYRIANLLGCKSQERVQAIAQKRDDYLKGTQAAEWSAGQYDGKIHVAVTNSGFDESLRRTLAHEMAHACIASTGRWPAWLHEGVAQYVSGEVLSPSARNQLKSALRNNAIPRLDAMSQTFSRMSAEHARLAYGAALLAVETFNEVYKEFGLRNLLRSPNHLDTIARDLDTRMRQ